LYDGVWGRILSLPENFTIYPAHDYKGMTKSSVAEEKKLNPRLTKTKEEFINIMKNLGLPYPKKIDISLPANKVSSIEKYKDLLNNGHANSFVEIFFNVTGLRSL
jgi:sulfur dioxygenase